MSQQLTTENFATYAAELATEYPELAAIVKRWGMPQFWSRPSGFSALVLIILEQQISIDAAATMHRRLRRELGTMSAARVLNYGEKGLREFGITRQKSRYISAVAAAVNSRRLSLAGLERASDDDAMMMLTALPGIGPWSASVYLLSALRRPDIWPPGDLALIRTIAELLPRQHKAGLAEHGRRWRPMRAVAARLLWHHYLCSNNRRPG